MTKLRDERAEDTEAIAAVLDAAFGGEEESRLVSALRAEGSLAISQVAELDGRVVAHIGFSPVRVVRASGEARGLALAPMAVLPEHQGSGIGSSLVVSSLGVARELGVGWVVVLGHPEYYPRFGFERAAGFGLRCRWEVPQEHYMALELEPGSLVGVAGEVLYAAAFDAL